jgi:endoglucanase
MKRFQKTLIASLICICIAGGSLWFASLHNTHAASHTSITYNAYAAGPYHTQGNMLLDATNQPYYFHGVARDGLEFSCNADSSLEPQYLALMGSQVRGYSGTFWYGNTVRLPVSEVLWLYDHTQNGYACTPALYQALIQRTIDTLSILHLNVILDLQWSDAGGFGPAISWRLPDADSVTFWQQAAKTYASYPNVLFELYNEPHPLGASLSALWRCWRVGCPVVNDTSYELVCNCQQLYSYQGVGMQDLVDAVRGVGANNLVLVGGTNWGFDLSGVPIQPLTGTNIVYDTHPYPYNGKNTVSEWDAAFGELSATYPIISAESGEYDCQSTFLSQLIPYFDAHHISWLAWAWFVGGNPCNFPQLVTDYNGTPASAMGTYIYQTLLGYAGITPQTAFNAVNPGTGPVSQQWYFAGEPEGGGFSQTLILANPSVQACNVTIQYVLDRSSARTKTVTLTLDNLARTTLHVDQDIGISTSASALEVAEIISTTGSACSGIVAERSLQINIPGLAKNGSALLGQTKASPTFYFADIPSGKQTDTAFSLLNPGTVQTTVTISYFAAGHQIKQQHLTLLAQGTMGIKPLTDLPTHTQAMLTSDQPIIAGFTTLLMNINAGRAGQISGFAEIMGTPQTASDWLFAQSSTRPGFQENLTIANFTTNTAHLTIILNYTNGQSDTFQLAVDPQSQTTWDINAHIAQNAHASPDLALEVQADTPIAVQRSIYFHYSIGSNQITGLTQGTGLTKTAASSAYTFADAYISPNFDQWLALQNATNKQELITITLTYQRQPYSYQVYLPPNGRGTIFLNRLLSLLKLPNQTTYDLSLTVISDGGAFVAERSMYWGAPDRQGGADVMGYAGG